MSDNNKITRCGFLGSSIVVVAAAGTADCFGSSDLSRAFSSKEKIRKRSIRFAHITDTHVKPEQKAPEGFASALRHIQSQKDKPEIIITGGDHIMESMRADDNRTKVQWDIFKKVVKEECKLPIKYRIGNHDCWGLNKKKSGTTGNEPN